MKKLEEMNRSSMELSQMSRVRGGANGQTDTMTVTGNRETGETTVTNDGADAEYKPAHRVAQ